MKTVPVVISQFSGATSYEQPWGSIMAASMVVTIPLGHPGHDLPVPDRGRPHRRCRERLITLRACVAGRSLSFEGEPGEGASPFSVRCSRLFSARNHSFPLKSLPPTHPHSSLCRLCAMLSPPGLISRPNAHAVSDRSFHHQTQLPLCGLCDLCAMLFCCTLVSRTNAHAVTDRVLATNPHFPSVISVTSVRCSPNPRVSPRIRSFFRSVCL